MSRPQQAVGSAARQWLQQLVGDWELTGVMGTQQLRQVVQAQWALGSKFVEMRCSSIAPGANGQQYEAIYFIGYDEASEALVFHLLDSLGVATVCPVGIGRLDGDVVEFRFDYASGPFVNRFSYDRATGSWRHDLISLAGGAAQTFATKILSRASNAERA